MTKCLLSSWLAVDECTQRRVLHFLVSNGPSATQCTAPCREETEKFNVRRKALELIAPFDYALLIRPIIVGLVFSNHP